MKFNKSKEEKLQREDTQTLDTAAADLVYAEPDRLPDPTPEGAPSGPATDQPGTPVGQISESAPVLSASFISAADGKIVVSESHVRMDFDKLAGAGCLNPSNWSLKPIEDNLVEFVHVNGTVVRSNIAEFNLFLTTGVR